MKLINVSIILCSFLFIQGCTSGSGGSELSSVFPDSSKDVSTKDAQKQIEDIQSKINSEPQYSLNSDEAIFLSEQGVVADEAELKGWVK